MTKWWIWHLDEILYIVDFKKFSQYPAFRIMAIDLTTHVVLVFHLCISKGIENQFFLPPTTPQRGQWLMLASAAMQCYTSSQTQGERSLCLPNTAKFSCSLTNIVTIFQSPKTLFKLTAGLIFLIVSKDRFWFSVYYCH